jgi:subtilisin family serine protease
MRRAVVWSIVALIILGPAWLAPPVAAVSSTIAAGLAAQAVQSTDYVVLYADGAGAGAARAAIAAAGGTIVRENAKIGVATVRTSNGNFLSAVQGQRALAGAARNRAVGRLPQEAQRTAEVRRAVERLTAERAAGAGGQGEATVAAVGAEPLAALQWDMRMIGATPEGSYAVQKGDKRVRVGIIDTGVDGKHPDIAPNFSYALSRNFVTDIPSIDGPCEVPSCVDPVDVDDDGHGTHVAGTIGAALNGLGIAGVAPNVTLVNIRAGQDSGYFFLQPTVDALVYAGDAGIDVVNMSFFIDPWLYNCANNPADSPAEQLEQRTIIAATQRALDYASARRVTLVAAAGNEHTDLGRPTFDDISPDYPPGNEKERTVDNSCLTMPAEGRGVIAVSSIGPSTAKADYSNYGVEQTDVAAPGGYFRDLLGTPQHRTVANLILSPFPKHVAAANGELNPDGTPNTPFVVRDCQGGVCAYYQYLQGTSMAAPHATGVVALIISQYGVQHVSGLTMNPQDTRRILQGSATKTACPEPRLFSYQNVGRPASYDARCEGDTAFNGFYGHGIVNAHKAVTYQRIWARPWPR